MNRGEDSFLASSALLFALLAWALWLPSRLIEGSGGMPVCGGVILCIVSTFLSFGGLLERATSKMFPLVSLGLNGVLIVVLFLGFRR